MSGITGVVPTQGRASLEKLLQSVAMQGLRPGDEYIVVVDTFQMEEDQLRDIIARIMASCPEAINHFKVLAHDAGHCCWGHCVPGDSLLQAGPTQAMTRRWYSGPLAVILLGGSELAVTPNHPVWTQRGWIAAKDVQQGDYLVSAVPRDGALGGHPNIQREPSLASEVFDALGQAGAPQRMMTAAVDFHGDGMAGEVDVVRADRVLPQHRFGVRQPTEKIVLPGSYLPRAMPLSRLRLSAELLEAVAVGSPSGMGGSAEEQALLAGHLGHANELRLGVGAQREAGSLESQPDGLQGNAYQPPDLLQCESGSVSRVEVIGTDVRPFSGHVFNLVTDSGWYVANGVIIHNCQLNMALEQARPGNYITFNDDDDIYAFGAWDAIRREIATDQLHSIVGRPRCHIFKFRAAWRQVLPEGPELVEGRVGGHCLVVPNVGKVGRLTCRYNGDWDLIASTVAMWDDDVVFHDDVLALARPTEEDYWWTPSMA